MTRCSVAQPTGFYLIPWNCRLLVFELSATSLTGESSKQRGYILQTFESLPQDISMSRRSAYLSRVLMYLLSLEFLLMIQCILSPSCLLSLSTSSICLAHRPSWLWRDGNLLSSLFCPVLEAFSFEHSVSFISVVFCSQFNPGHHSYIFKTYTTSGNLVSLPKRGKIPSNNLGLRHLCCSLVSVTGFSLNCVG